MGLVIAAVFVVALQKESLFRTQIGNTKPDLVIVFLVCVAMHTGAWPATVGGLLAGLLQGATLPAGGGAVLVSRGALGYAAGRLGGIIAAENVLMCIPFAFLGTWLSELVHYAVHPWIGFSVWASTVAVESLLNAAVCPVFYFAVAWIAGAARK